MRSVAGIFVVLLLHRRHFSWMSCAAWSSVFVWGFVSWPFRLRGFQRIVVYSIEIATGIVQEAAIWNKWRVQRASERLGSDVRPVPLMDMWWGITNSSLWHIISYRTIRRHLICQDNTGMFAKASHWSVSRHRCEFGRNQVWPGVRHDHTVTSKLESSPLWGRLKEYLI